MTQLEFQALCQLVQLMHDTSLSVNDYMAGVIRLRGIKICDAMAIQCDAAQGAKLSQYRDMLTAE